jgi:hypothetical protein
MIKLTVLLPRNTSMTREAFVKYHREVHAKLLRGDEFTQSLVRRYEQAHNMGVTIPGIDLPEHDFDGIAELWFDNLDDLVKYYTDDHYFEVIQPDEMRFIDHSRALVMISTINVVF